MMSMRPTSHLWYYYTSLWRNNQAVGAIFANHHRLHRHHRRRTNRQRIP